jgi:hypothetical protein
VFAVGFGASDLSEETSFAYQLALKWRSLAYQESRLLSELKSVIWSAESATEVDQIA